MSWNDSAAFESGLGSQALTHCELILLGDSDDNDFLYDATTAADWY